VKVEAIFIIFNFILMATIVNNDKNFLIVRVTSDSKDYVEYCESCNSKSDSLYYISCLNSFLCEDCMNDFVKCMNHYTDYNSLIYEIKHFNHYANILNIDTKAGLTPDGKLVLFSKNEIKN
jgi:hypothetical protein